VLFPFLQAVLGWSGLLSTLALMPMAVANAVEAAAGAGSRGPALIRAAQESFVDGWQGAMRAGVAVMAALFAHVLVGGPGNPARAAVDEVTRTGPVTS
jgi:hypothetical protein